METLTDLLKNNNMNIEKLDLINNETENINTKIIKLETKIESLKNNNNSIHSKYENSVNIFKHIFQKLNHI
jgi:predicted RNase H-like nuclease (RuvC/YqgF family)